MPDRQSYGLHQLLWDTHNCLVQTTGPNPFLKFLRVGSTAMFAVGPSAAFEGRDLVEFHGLILGRLAFCLLRSPAGHRRLACLRLRKQTAARDRRAGRHQTIGPR
jgi:hypothetical protein